ncbi:IS3 family transposase [Gimesia sp.]
MAYQERYTTRQTVSLSVFVHIETFCNRKRKHSALGDKSPGQF